MDKLSLKLEELRVESYSPESDGADARGTVHGRESNDSTCVGTNCACVTGDDPACFTLISECVTECGPCTQGWSCRSNCYESCVFDC